MFLNVCVFEYGVHSDFRYGHYGQGRYWADNGLFAMDRDRLAMDRMGRVITIMVVQWVISWNSRTMHKGGWS